MNFGISSKALDEMTDTIQSAKALRVPVVINITDTTVFRDGTSKTYMYRNCQLGYSRDTRRGQATGISIDWISGEHRAAL